jgi:hypothetical protein
VWCHDYHLMCLPKFLKDLDSHMKVGWFLHTPFPSSEIYRTLPLRSELLKAVLTADLIGCVCAFPLSSCLSVPPMVWSKSSLVGELQGSVESQNTRSSKAPIYFFFSVLQHLLSFCQMQTEAWAVWQSSVLQFPHIWLCQAFCECMHTHFGSRGYTWGCGGSWQAHTSFSCTLSFAFNNKERWVLG